MKKQKFTRLIALLLAAMLLILAACGNGTTQPPPANGEIPPPRETANEPGELGMGRIHPYVDFGGRELTLGGWFDLAGVALTAIHTGEEPDPATSFNYYMERLLWENTNRVLEGFNITITETIVGYDDLVPTLTATVGAGDPFADVVLLSGHMQLSAIQGDLIHNLENIDLPNSDILGSQIYSGPVTVDLGGTWSFHMHSLRPNAVLMGVNLDIINAIGAANPLELYHAGEWTWDAALEIMRAATRDTTGDGIHDQFGIAGQPVDLAEHFIASNDGRMVTPDFQYGFDMPNTLEALEFIEVIFQEGLWHYCRVSGDPMGEWERNFHAGPVEASSALFATVAWSLDANPPPFNYTVVPFPSGPQNTSGNSWLAGWQNALVLPRHSEWAPEEIIMIMEELFAWPGDDPELLFEGGELNWLREIFPTEEDVQMAISVSTQASTDIGRDVAVGGVGYGWITGTFIYYFMNGYMGVLPAIEAHRGPQQEMLDLMLNR